VSTTVVEKQQTGQKNLDIEELIHQLEEAPVSRKKLASLLAEEQHPSKPLKMTYQEFLEWADEDTLAEWVSGEVIMSSPASLPHQNIVGFLYELLKSYVIFHNLGTVIQAPFQMKLEQGREPDVLFIAQKHENRLKETYLDGPADLVVEVISPESAGRDRGDKFYEYERGGVPEYWLIDPLTQRAEFYQLAAATGQYHLIPIEAGEVYRSALLPGFWLRVDWLWQEPLLHPLQVLGEIAGLAQQEVDQFLKLLKGQKMPTR
jgi:Uma2 family endonuclease